MTDEIIVELEACEPEELFWHGRENEQRPTPPGIWLRLESADESSPWPVVAIRGERAAVRAYIADHWGEDDADALIEVSAPAEVDPMGPETDRGGLIGQMPY